MSSTRTRWTLPQVSFLAIALLGMWGCCSVPCDPKGQLIVVREKETRDAYQLIVISKSKHQEIVWKLSSGSSYTNVAIHLGGHPEPFVNCSTTGAVCEIRCEHQLCFSGSINPAIPASSLPITYDYQFGGPGGVTSSDPGIRIDP